MNPNLQTMQPGYGRSGLLLSSEQRNRVLRNTYWLLALSMLPTIAGAWLGVATGIVSQLSTGTSLLVFLGGSLALMFAIERTKNSAAGVGFLLLFTFLSGLMLSRLLGVVLGLADGANLIMLAFAGTAAVFVGMASLSTMIKKDLSGLSKALFIGLILLLVASVANIFLHSSGLMIMLCMASIGIFSVWTLYDLKRVQDGYETNYISATLSIYINLFNVFQSLLSLLGLSSQRD